MEATGKGHFVGVTMSVLQNQDFWWGEGDDMFFIDGDKHPIDHRDRDRKIIFSVRMILGARLRRIDYSVRGS